MYFFYDSIERNGLFGLGIAACDLDGTVLEVTATHGEANGHTLEFVVGELITRRIFLFGIDFDADAEGLELVGNGVEFYHQFIEVLLFLEDGHDNHLDRR